MEVIVLDGQSLFDIAIQECGSVEAAFDLAVANNISMSNELASSQSLNITPVVNKQVVEYYKNKRLQPATWTRFNEVQLTGIDFMSIEIDFTVG